MQKALRENKLKIRSRLEEQRKAVKKEKIKETILTGGIGLFIITLLIICLSNMNHKFVNNCEAAGHSQSYCERGI